MQAVQILQSCVRFPPHACHARHHAAHYGAGRMTLCVLGAEPLDTLQAWCTELFGRVPAGAGEPKPNFISHGSMMANCGGVLYRTPAVKEAHELTLSFSLPPMPQAYDAKPDECVCERGGVALCVMRRALTYACLRLRAGTPRTCWDTRARAACCPR